LLSHLPLGRAVDLRPAELHALRNSALQTCFDPSISPRSTWCRCDAGAYHAAGFRILEWMNYSNKVIEHYERTLSAPPNKLTNRLILGEDARADHIYWMITAERPKL